MYIVFKLIKEISLKIGGFYEWGSLCNENSPIKFNKNKVISEWMKAGFFKKLIQNIYEINKKEIIPTYD